LEAAGGKGAPGSLSDRDRAAPRKSQAFSKPVPNTFLRARAIFGPASGRLRPPARQRRIPMSTQQAPGGLMSRLPITPRAILGGLLVGMVAANIWPLLLYQLGAPVAAAIELIFLGLY